MTNARTVAIDVLIRVDDGAYSNLVLPGALRRARLSDRDRAFATDLVYGTLRMQGRVDTLLDPYLDRPLASLDPAARAALRMGVYQLLSEVPAHAAVGETVSACARRAARARGFVNAVLRRVADSGAWRVAPVGDDLDTIAARTSMPPWIVAAARTRFGEDAEALLQAMNDAPTLTLRVAPEVDPDAVAAELRAGGADVESGVFSTRALRVRGAGDPAAMAVVRDGRATPQDEGSQAVVATLGIQPGMRVLDLAAAPGGKSTAIAELVGPDGLVVALEVDAARVARIAEAVQRVGVPWCTPLVADGRAIPLHGTFDVVLLDAPCSGLGVLRRRAEARWRITPEDVASLAALQRELIAAAAPYVAPGGVLAYSVCTWTPEETDAIIGSVAASLEGFAPEAPPGSPWVATPGGALLAPSVSDGMFVARFRRTAAT